MEFNITEQDLGKIKKDIQLIIIKNVKNKNEEDISKKENYLPTFQKNESYHIINHKSEISEKNELIDNSIQNKNEKIFKLLATLTKDSYSDYILDNTFALFTSIDDIIYLIYTNKFRSIISYNVLDNKKVNEIKKAHTRDITNFRHFFDKIKKRDLLISISLSDNNLKLWNINNYECLFNFENVNKSGKLFSSCLFNDNDATFIITSCAYGNNESIKIFDLNCNIVKEINNSKDSTFFIDIYYDYITSKMYIITGNNGYIKSYDYNENQEYHKYNDNDNKRHCSIVIHNKENIIKIIESSFDGNIRIWNFHSGELLNKIKICDNDWLLGINLWDEEHLLVGCGDKTIKAINLRKGVIISKSNNFKSKIVCLKKLIHPLYGGCLIIQGYENEQIKIFIKENIYK